VVLLRPRLPAIAARHLDGLLPGSDGCPLITPLRVRGVALTAGCVRIDLGVLLAAHRVWEGTPLVHISRFPTRDRFAAFNGTAPIEVSSGGREIWRLSRRGNRTLNHAIHMAAVTQVRFAPSPGRGYYDRKIAEGKTPKEAMRALKRRISDALWAAMVADARRLAATKSASGHEAGPGGQPGSDSVASAAGLHPDTPTLRHSHSRTRLKATTTRRSTRSRPSQPMTKKVPEAS
jgi:hypothetical protein